MGQKVPTYLPARQSVVITTYYLLVITENYSFQIKQDILGLDNYF